MSVFENDNRDHNALAEKVYREYLKENKTDKDHLVKIYYLTQHGLKFDCRGYFDCKKENLEKMLKDWSDPKGWRIEEMEVKVPGRLV